MRRVLTWVAVGICAFVVVTGALVFWLGYSLGHCGRSMGLADTIEADGAPRPIMAIIDVKNGTSSGWVYMLEAGTVDGIHYRDDGFNYGNRRIYYQAGPGARPELVPGGLPTIASFLRKREGPKAELGPFCRVVL